MAESNSRRSCVEWGVASKPCSGELACGDHFFVREFEARALIVVMDALGHGLMAASTAQLAFETLGQHAEKPITQIFEHCHKALLRSRGVAMSVASLDFATNTLTWLGVGNVEGLLVRAERQKPASESLTVLGGVVGYQMPTLHPTTRVMNRGDSLVLATDGMDRRFVERLYPFGNPKDIAHDLLGGYAKETDDALILIVRYVGAQQ